MELEAFGVSVHVIEPGFFATGIAEPQLVARRTAQAFENAPLHVREQYGKQYMEQSQQTAFEVLHVLTSVNVEKVVDAYEHATLGWYPRGRYLLGWDANLFFWPLSLLPEWLSEAIKRRIRPMPTPAAAVK